MPAGRAVRARGTILRALARDQVAGGRLARTCGKRIAVIVRNRAGTLESARAGSIIVPHNHLCPNAPGKTRRVYPSWQGRAVNRSRLMQPRIVETAPALTRQEKHLKCRIFKLWRFGYRLTDIDCRLRQKNKLVNAMRFSKYSFKQLFQVSKRHGIYAWDLPVSC